MLNTIIKSDTIRFMRDINRQLYMENGNGKYGPLTAKRGFPLTAPDQYIILLTGEDEDLRTVGILDSLNGLDNNSRSLLEDELDQAYFLPKIIRILDIDDQFSVMKWIVETDRGPRKFEVVDRKRDIRWLSDDHLIIEDADGNRYEILDLSKLDSASREKVEMEV
jgi:hypothetical protein